MLKAVFFDLDGTLLPLNEDEFSQAYFKLLAEHMEPYGYTKDEIINEIKSLSLKVMLTTNPIFPFVATKERMGFIGLKPEDFDYVTTYENSKYTKPNPLYFKEVMDLFNLKSDEVILFGNNTKEDGDAARALGIKCYLVTGNIIYNDDSKWNYKEIKMNQIVDIIKMQMQNK